MTRCEKATGNIGCLRVLNINHETWKLVAKLPKWVADRWRRIVHHWKTGEVTFPPLPEFVKFLSREAGSACDPEVSVHSFREDHIKKTNERDKCNRFTPMPRECKRLIGCNFLVAGTKNSWSASQQAPYYALPSM